MQYTESMHYLLSVFFFVFGSLLGSFSNVVVLRMASGKSVVFPPSACPKCNHQLRAIDLVPIFSWLFLKGKCRYCKEPISIQYPLVESFMALILSLSFFKVGLERSGLDLICLSSAMAVWFVVSTVFIRNEVVKYRPFVWALVYSIGLKYFMTGVSMFSMDFLLILAFSALVGIIASIRSDSIDFIRWFALSLLPFIYMPVDLYSYLTVILLLAAFFNCSKNKRVYARWVLYVVQLFAILLNLYFIKTIPILSPLT